jgi:hypothetical protein
MANKVFQINGNGTESPLTVDSTLYTVDNTHITIDATVIDIYHYLLRVITRYEAGNIEIQFKNELTKETSIIEIISMKYDREHLEAYFDYDFQEGDSFEIKVIDLDQTDPRKNIIWRGKGYATMQDDLENYRLITKSDNEDIIIMD